MPEKIVDVAPVAQRSRLTRPPFLAPAALVGAAILALMSACDRKPASVEELYATRMAGIGYLQRNQLAEAESAFKKLARLAPDDPLGYANLGLTYLQAGRLDDAEEALDARARQVDGLLAEHRLAGPSPALDEIRMGSGGGADQDCVHVRMLDDLV